MIESGSSLLRMTIKMERILSNVIKTFDRINGKHNIKDNFLFFTLPSVN